MVVVPTDIPTRPLRPMQLSDRYELNSGRIHVTGIQALVRLPLERHRRDAAAGRHTATFISGYEGSPLGGYDLELSRQQRALDSADITFRPALNEEYAATAVAGSQLAQTLDGQRYDGVVGIWYGKSPGLDRATDAFRHANLMGAAPTGGAVALVGDDPGAKSSTIPGACEAALADLMMPTLYPADPQEVLDLGVHAVEMSRISGLWTAMKIVTAVADGACTVEVDPDRVRVVDPGGGRNHQVTGRLLQPALGPLERGLVTTRITLAAQYARANDLNTVTVRGPRDRIGVIAPGKTYLDVRSALRRLGFGDDELRAAGIRVLRLRMVFPIHADTIRDFARDLDHIVVIEEKRAFVEPAVKDALYGLPDAPQVRGKLAADGSELFAAYGELDTDNLLAPLARHLTKLGVALPRPLTPPARSAALLRRSLPLAVSRAPYFCSGCPHNSSTKPSEGSLVGAGIGCHAMVLLMDPAQVGEVTGVTQMGGEGTQWIGMAPFLDAQHFVQNLGDGTFAHSGSLAVRAAVAAGVNITYKLLYNSTVAMTGGQDAVGALPVPRLVDLLVAEGVGRIIVTTEDLGRYRRVRLPRGVDLWDRSRLDEAQRALAATPGVTVLIHDQECAAEKRRKRKRNQAITPATRVVINERICEGCGDCGRKSNCLSVHPVDTEYGRKTRIHQGSCNLDYSCLQGDCPAFMVVEPGTRTDARHRPSSAPRALPHDDVDEPPVRVSPRQFGVRMTGVGGTGVVTISQILATAATMAGLYVRSLDQTGLAQKGGTVLSDMRLSDEPFEAAAKLPAGECDLYLGFDLLAGAAAANLAAASTDRTVAVVSTTRTPTGRMVSDPAVTFPDDADTVGRILAATDPGAAILIDAGALAQHLFADDASANMILLGAAYQSGRLPISAAAIEAAIELNGVAVARNVQAFRHGRRRVADQSGQNGAESPATSNDADSLDSLVAARTADLAAYHSSRYAGAYADFVATSRRTEAAATGGETITLAVARNLYKLMAYKDEYEVARLALDHSEDQARREFGEGARVSWKLHPPVLRALGMRRKVTLGPWFAPAFEVLRRMRRLRGTPLDPFGHTTVRRTERQLVTEYRDAVTEALGHLHAHNAATVLELAELPDLVRGYEEIKLTSVITYRERLAALHSTLAIADANARGVTS